MGRAGVDSPTSPNHYFRGALMRWAWHPGTKSDQIDGWTVQLFSRRGCKGKIDGWSVQLFSRRGCKGKIENTCGEKKASATTGN